MKAKILADEFLRVVLDMASSFFLVKFCPWNDEGCWTTYEIPQNSAENHIHF